MAKFVTTTINSGNDLLKARNGMFNTVLGLLLKGDINCAGGGINRGDLFEQQNDNEGKTVPERPTRQATEVPTGTIRTAQEEEKAAEEARRRKAQQEAEERAAREEAAAEEIRRRKENRWWNRAKRGLDRIVSDITKPE